MVDFEKQYNPRKSVNNYETLLQQSYAKAKIANNLIKNKINIAYGEGELQKLDVHYNAYKTHKPIHIFIHGGYWRGLDKSYHTHMAIPFCDKNIIFFNVNYDLCPLVKLSDIKNQIISAIIWIYKNAKKYNGNNQSITLSGHSAGAHLISLMLGVNWKLYDIPAKIFKGAALISGIYDTNIVLKLKINKEIQLTEEEAYVNNAFKIDPKINIPVILAYGALEPELWKMQTKNYRDFLKKNNFKTDLIECMNDNHFTLIDTIADKRASLVRKMINFSLKHEENNK